MSSGVQVKRVTRPNVRTHSGSSSRRSAISKAATAVKRVPVSRRVGQGTHRSLAGKRTKVEG